MKTRTACLIAVFCSVGCARIDGADGAHSTGDASHTSITLADLVYVDMFAADYRNQHPLVCGAGGDFPAGREMVFRRSESGKSIHVVFPDKTAAPENVKGTFVLRGWFQGIQNVSLAGGKLQKKLPAEYRYFVVASWEQKVQQRQP